mgnify:CR=1 FL=1
MQSTFENGAAVSVSHDGHGWHHKLTTVKYSVLWVLVIMVMGDIISWQRWNTAWSVILIEYLAEDLSHHELHAYEGNAFIAFHTQYKLVNNTRTQQTYGTCNDDHTQQT